MVIVMMFPDNTWHWTSAGSMLAGIGPALVQMLIDVFMVLHVLHRRCVVAPEVCYKCGTIVYQAPSYESKFK